MPYDYGRPTLRFGFASGFPPDVAALLATVFVTFSLQFFAATAWIPELLRLTPLAWQRLLVWQLVTYPYAGIGDASLWIVLELLFLFWFARDVFARLGRPRFWRLLLWSCTIGGGIALSIDAAARWVHQVSPASLLLLQGQRMLLAVLVAAFAVLYRDAQILLFFVIPVQARWFLPLEVLFAFIGFLRSHDLAGFLGICAALAVVWVTLGYGGFRRAAREGWLRAQGWWLRRRMTRLRRKRGFTVVDDRRDPWLH